MGQLIAEARAMVERDGIDVARAQWLRRMGNVMIQPIAVRSFPELRRATAHRDATLDRLATVGRLYLGL